MPEAPRPRPSRPASQFERIHLLADHPVDIEFALEHPQSRVGIAASVATHIVLALIAFAIIHYGPNRLIAAIDEPQSVTNLVFLPIPGPGGGGGGGGNKMPEPPKKAELVGKEKVTVPVAPKPRPVEIPKEPPPAEDLNIPAKTMAAAEQPLPGAIESAAITTSQGSGSAGGAGTGTGSGIGPGQGSGLGPGYGGGTGGGAYRPGSGVSLPRVLKEVKPQYTADAMRAKVQGTVWVECIVLPDGNVGDTKIIRSLDPVFGLDQEAVRAARQWKFVPGTLQGNPVPVIITIELTFTLR